MEKGQIWAVVLVSLIVAVIASVATASITGNVIKQNTNIYGKYELYTKPEIDYKFANLKATSCDGDAICEANSISNPAGELLLTSAVGSNIKISPTTGAYGKKGYIILDGSVNYLSVDATATFKTLARPTSGNMTVTDKAYVCADEFGHLYRSSKVCV